MSLQARSCFSLAILQRRMGSYDLVVVNVMLIMVSRSWYAGVSIAIMGCIVNGPGEMADADFGYVGGAPGKIDLYVGKEVVKRAINHEIAPDALIDLIKEYGRWVEPEEAEEAEESPEMATTA